MARLVPKSLEESGRVPSCGFRFVVVFCFVMQRTNSNEPEVVSARRKCITTSGDGDMPESRLPITSRHAVRDGNQPIATQYRP